MKRIVQIALFALLTACSTEGVKKETETQEQDALDTVVIDTNIKVKDELSVHVDSNSTEKEWASGLRIVWEEKLGAERLKNGDVVKLDYVGRTPDGKIFDSSKKIGRFIPVRIGWGMLIEGWDQALKEMATGEKAKISIPSALAYGEKGDGRRIGPNMDLNLELEVKEKLKPVFDSSGIQVYIVEKFLEGENPRPVAGHEKMMFDYWSFTEDGKRYDSSYEKGHAFVWHIGDQNLNYGLRTGLMQLKEGESAYIHVPSEHGFGKKGLPGMVGPNKDLMFIVTVKKVE
ncbi:MAG: FKBP-type peptidyl-prolyl cis-trans isomerase [Crocinitomicaceae bacterium]